MQRENMPRTAREPADFAEAINHLLSEMTLEEKVGQVTMVENNSIEPAQVAEFCIGSVLSGGGGNPTPNSPSDWREMVLGFQQAALQTRLRIPLIYAVDAVHGHNNVKGTVIFPHNIGLGATRDPDLVERIGRITAREMLATSVQWTFAPSVSVPQDLRWGRTYEGYSDNTQLVAELGAALVRGLQNGPDDQRVLACAKHYVADGATKWREIPTTQDLMQQGSTAPPQAAAPAAELDLTLGQWQIDQGISDIDESTLRANHLPPYIDAIDAGVLSVMASYSTWDGMKLHAHRYLLTDVLKDELGFAGLVVTDWMAINQIDSDYSACIVTAVNAGIDMIMVPYDYKRFISTLMRAVQNGDVTRERLDDSVRRILLTKFAFGLFDAPFGDESLLQAVGGAEHRQVAREAVSKSCVLLKNEGDLLPLPNDLPQILVAGAAADDIGLQCGGWTVSWQGEAGATTAGATILAGIRLASSANTTIEYMPDGDFAGQARTELGIVVLNEAPYAEGFGDRADLKLPADQITLLERVRERCDRLLVILIAGRPCIISEQLPLMDALVVAWLPGSEGNGLADVLFGEHPFSGKLPFNWPRVMQQVPLAALPASEAGPLWECGFGLTTRIIV